MIEDELGAIKEACEEFGNLNGREGWKPLFTVVVATKRHNARFFVDREGRKPLEIELLFLLKILLGI